MGDPALTVRAAGKSYESRGRPVDVFRDLDFTVARGEVFALLGPSGCGKSTLLRIVAGLEEPSGGDVIVHEEAPAAAEAGGAAERGGRAVGIAFQQPLLLPWLTVAGNIELGLRFRANRAAAETEPVHRVVDEFGLAPIADAYPGQISGGQAQRVSLARTVVTHPRVLLLDEPLGALDPATRRRLQDWLLEIKASRDLTVLIVTHDVDEAVYVGDRVALMSPSPGRIVDTWETGDLRGRDEGAGRAVAVRREILSRYEEDRSPARRLAASA